MDERGLSRKSAISPIIATLLLVLIAIASGVVLYAYVAGFISNSTTNPGGTINSISIDYLVLNHAQASFPATAYVRDLGPSTEQLNTGFYLKSTSINDVLVPAVSLACGSCTSATVTAVSIVEATSGTLSITVTFSSCSTGCTVGTTTMIANGFGASQTTLTEATGGTTFTGTLTFAANTFSVSTSPAFTASASALSQATTTTAQIFGLTVTQGTLNIGVNNVGGLTLALAPTTTAVAANPLTSGNTYTVQVTGIDGSSTSLSAKSA